jgi:hypothetical protein
MQALNLKSKGIPPSDERIVVENALKAAIGPLSARELVEITGLSIWIVRTHLANGIRKLRVQNIYEGNGKKGAYVWGAEEPEAPRVTGERFVPVGSYNGAELKPFTGRAGAMKAYEIGSIENGQQIARRAPLIMGA